MRHFDPTLIDAIFNFAPYVQKMPEAFKKTENLSSFSSARYGRNKRSGCQMP
jgi:hypothetical protein